MMPGLVHANNDKLLFVEYCMRLFYPLDDILLFTTSGSYLWQYLQKVFHGDVNYYLLQLHNFYFTRLIFVLSLDVIFLRQN